MNVIALLKCIHIMSIVTWLGGLGSVTALLGWVPDQHVAARWMLRKITFWALVLTVAIGAVLLVNQGMAGKGGWFHLKLTTALLLIVVHWRAMCATSHNASLRMGKVLFACWFVLLFLAVFAIYVLKTQNVT